MHFKDNEAAFEMVCKNMDTDIVQDKPVIAISMQEMKKTIRTYYDKGCWRPSVSHSQQPITLEII